MTERASQTFGPGGALNMWEEKGHLMNELMTTAFAEQRLYLPRSVKKMFLDISNFVSYRLQRIG